MTTDAQMVALIRAAFLCSSPSGSVARRMENGRAERHGSGQDRLLTGNGLPTHSKPGNALSRRNDDDLEMRKAAQEEGPPKHIADGENVA
ncbi:MAG TPA: hypothetical protein VNU68_13680 [Verrucomicrobiae bacterium]|jgi:hypothetical protein|nr:hypothetical protein [Verrucomicrobiae bacterium]